MRMSNIISIEEVLRGVCVVGRSHTTYASGDNIRTSSNLKIIHFLNILVIRGDPKTFRTDI